MYDTLFGRGTRNQPVPGLCLSAEPSQGSKVWTLAVRPGVTWHDGQPFTADDVANMFTAVWADPKNTNNRIASLVDTKRVRKRGPHHVEIPLHIPITEFPSLLIPTTAGVTRRGTNFGDTKSVVGTGPFKVKSFSPEGSTFVANRDYWEHGKPYVDEVVVNSSFSDDSARLNALISGNASIMFAMPFDLAKPSSQYQVLRSHTPTFIAFCMRCDAGPLADVRLRQAMRLAVNRPALVQNALLGFGESAYDLAVALDPYYATSLKRDQDIEQAKHLLKQAGQEKLRITLDTGSAGPGFLESATLLKQQVAAAGITVELNQVPSSEYYTSPAGYGTHPFRQTQWSASTSSLTTFWLTSSATNAPYNLETRWATPGTDKVLRAAVSAVAGDEARQKWFDFQKLYFDTGGYILWNSIDALDGLANNVKGLTPSAAGYLAGGRVQDAWLS
jgi:peptide/nickel transport system substrate-binding protein